jgi:hypothetical protein
VYSVKRQLADHTAGDVHHDAAQAGPDDETAAGAVRAHTGEAGGEDRDDGLLTAGLDQYCSLAGGASLQKLLGRSPHQRRGRGQFGRNELETGSCGRRRRRLRRCP